MDEDDTPSEKRGALFRAEALAERQDRWLGSVLLAPTVPHTVYTTVAAGITAGVIALMGFGEYTRKARLSGWLAPEQGLIQVVAPQAGVLTQVRAQEGLEVEAGAALAVLSAERRSEAVGATQGEVVRALRARRDSLAAERERHRALFAAQAEARAARLAVIEAEAADLEKEFALQRERVALAEEAAARQRALRERALATEINRREAEEEALDQALALQTLERARAALARSRVEIESETAEAPLREELRLAEIDRAVAEIDQELAEAEAARELVVAAPQSGTVTALLAGAGDAVDPSEPLMTLVPAGAELEARLYGPSRDIGFVRPGQRVLIRYEAFPHQKFGQYGGVVASVSRATVGAGELAQASAGPLTTLAAEAEPVYRIVVTLDAQAARAYGAPAALQPGMTLEADVLIETRRLYEWVLDPLHSLTGRGSA